MVAIAGAIVGAFAFAGAGAGAGAGAVTVTGAAFLTAKYTGGRRLRGIFFVCLTVGGLWGLLYWLPSSLDIDRAARTGGLALILFLPVFALVNAPFDWLSLGFTRWLMRMGLDKGGWWPVWLAFVDLVAAFVCLVILSVALLLVVQAFNLSVQAQGGDVVFDPRPVLRDLASPQTRWEPEYWWIYATVFSTLLPSLVNLFVGSLSLLRGIGPLRAYIARQLEVDRRLIRLERVRLSLLIALQFPLALAMACAMLAGFLALVWWLWFPAFAGFTLGILGDLAL